MEETHIKNLELDPNHIILPDDADVVIHNENYYRSLLNSFRADELSSIEYQKLLIRKAELKETDERSPFQYLRPGIHAKRLIKTLLVKSSKAKGEDAIKVLKLDPKLEKEEKRTNYLCEREALQRIKARSATAHILDEACHKGLLSKREQNIEKQILAPFRHNENLTESLLKKIDNMKVQQRREHKLRQKAQEEAIRIDIDEKVAKAKARRDQIIEEERLLQIKLNEDRERKSENLLQQIAQNSHDVRVKQWMIIVIAYSKLAKVKDAVYRIRETRLKDVAKWKACVKIQRAYRRRINARKPVVKLTLVERMKQNISSKEQQELYQQRVEAAHLLEHFLFYHYFRGKAHCFASRIRKGQSYIRAHIDLNRARINLLTRFFDICLHPLALQINLVLSNKGLDLKNSMTPFEINNIKYAISSTLSSYPGYRNKTNLFAVNIINSFFTAEFHAYLRSLTNKLIPFQKEFLQQQGQQLQNPSSHICPEALYPKLWKDFPHLRDSLFRAILYHKRRCFRVELHFQEPIQIIVPQVTLEEAIDFIKGGDDPVLHHIDSVNKQLEEIHKIQSRPMYPFRRPPELTPLPDDPNAHVILSQWQCPMLLLLKSITAREILVYFLELGNLIHRKIYESLKGYHEFEALKKIAKSIGSEGTLVGANSNSGQPRTSFRLGESTAGSTNSAATSGNTTRKNSISQSRRSSIGIGQEILISSVNQLEEKKPIQPQSSLKKSTTSTRQQLHKLISSNNLK